MITAKKITEVLEGMYKPFNGWVFLKELRTSTGYTPSSRFDPLIATRSIDAFAMNTWPSNSYKKLAFEIKVNRGDWLVELDDSHKFVVPYLLCNEFWFVLSKEIFQEHDLKDFRELKGGAGLMIVDDCSTKVVLRPIFHDSFPMPEGFVASLLRSATRLDLLDKVSKDRRLENGNSSES